MMNESDVENGVGAIENGENETANFTVDDDDDDDDGIHDQLPTLEEYKSNLSNTTSVPRSMEDQVGVVTTNGGEEGQGDENDTPVHDQLPTLEEYKTTANPQPATSTCVRVVMCLAILVVIGLILVAILVPIYVTREENPSSSYFGGTRHPEVVEYLAAIGVSQQTDMLTPGTPQYKASKWIADEDKYKMELPEDNGIHSRFMERYILATLYFSTDGPNWTYQYQFLTTTDHCLWFQDFETASGTLRFGVHSCEPWEDQGYFVTRLGAPSNNLKGEIPNELGFLHKLQSFAAPFNQDLTGDFKPSWKGLVELRDLILQFCSLTGTIPDWIGDLLLLTNLGLGNNILTGRVPDGLFALTNLKQLGLDDNALEGDIGGFDKLRDLESLYLEGNGFSGTLTNEHVYAWSFLKELDLGQNWIGGSIPGDLFNMPALEVFDMHDNLLENKLPEVKNQTNTKLTYFTVFGNDIDGEIPSSFKNLVNLRHLDIAFNKLSNTIPEELGELSRLRYLYVGNNNFSKQAFPQSIFWLTDLGELSLKNCTLTGTIPTMIGKLSQLLLLDLDSNMLTGSIPLQIGNLRRLDHALLHRNRLNGTLPASMGLMSQLDILIIDNNDITGSADVICASKNVKPGYFVADCKDPDPEITCSCCQICCHDSNTTCNNMDWDVNLDPMWEYGYNRAVYQFGQNYLPTP